MATVTLKLDDTMKNELDEMVREMGMGLTTFFMICAKQALRERKIPFEREKEDIDLKRRREAFLRMEERRKKYEGIQTIDFEQARKRAMDEKYGVI